MGRSPVVFVSGLSSEKSPQLPSRAPGSSLLIPSLFSLFFLSLSFFRWDCAPFSFLLQVFPPRFPFLVYLLKQKTRAEEEEEENVIIPTARDSNLIIYIRNFLFC